MLLGQINVADSQNSIDQKNIAPPSAFERFPVTGNFPLQPAPENRRGAGRR